MTEIRLEQRWRAVPRRARTRGGPHPGRGRRAGRTGDDELEARARALLRDYWITNEAGLFAQLYEITAPRLHEIARVTARRIPALLEPEDLVAGLLARLFTDGRRAPREVRSFFGLARTAMHHEALDTVRRHERLARRHLAYHAGAPREAPDPARALDQRERGAALRRDAVVFLLVVGACVERLDMRTRDVLLARELGALSYDELADELDLPRGQVGMILKRARERLVRAVERALTRQACRARP